MARARRTVNPDDDSGIPWWPAPDGGRGSLSRDALATAAAEILESGGRAALTLRAVAQAVGAGTMSLYWYVDGKDDLVDLAVDRIMGAVELPSTGAWDERVRQVARAFRQVLVAHPAVLPLLAEGVKVGPNLLRIQEALLHALRDSGLPPGDVAAAASAVAALVTNAGMVAPPDAATWSAGKTIGDLSAERYPVTVELADELTRFDADERFVFGLDLLVDGLAARAAKER